MYKVLFPSFLHEFFSVRDRNKFLKYLQSYVIYNYDFSSISLVICSLCGFQKPSEFKA